MHSLLDEGLSGLGRVGGGGRRVRNRNGSHPHFSRDRTGPDKTGQAQTRTQRAAESSSTSSSWIQTQMWAPAERVQGVSRQAGRGHPSYMPCAIINGCTGLHTGQRPALPPQTAPDKPGAKQQARAAHPRMPHRGRGSGGGGGRGKGLRRARHQPPAGSKPARDAGPARLSMASPCQPCHARQRRQPSARHLVVKEDVAVVHVV